MYVYCELQFLLFYATDVIICLTFTHLPYTHGKKFLNYGFQNLLFKNVSIINFQTVNTGGHEYNTDLLKDLCPETIMFCPKFLKHFIY